MTDPLSVAASALTILSASTTCAKALQNAIREWRNAPDEIAQLNNEVVEVQVLLDSLCQTLKKGAQAEKGAMTATERKLNAVKIALADLEELMKKSFNGITHRRLKYIWIREKGRVRRTHKNLLKARYGLQEALSVGTL